MVETPSEYVPTGSTVDTPTIICSSNAVVVPACLGAPNDDGTCVYQAATPPKGLPAPAWTCTVTATPEPFSPLFPPNVHIHGTFSGAVTGLTGQPTARLLGTPVGGYGNYEMFSTDPAHPNERDAPTVGVHDHGGATGVQPGTYPVVVYPDPWSFIPICTTTVTVPANP